jgi:predicted alpha/beta superfamily hydrolase
LAADGGKAGHRATKEVIMLVRTCVRAALAAMAAFFLFQPAAHAEGPTLPLAIRSEKIVSAKVGETREFHVSLPDNYVTSSEKYPVLLMLDGEINFNSGVIGGLRHAAQLGEMPEFIIVGIVNTDRAKDSFPEELTYSDGSKAGGRADRFLDFIGEELIPHIDKNYRSEKFRVLYGTSNTGFTAVHALFRNPQLADYYIAASATLRVPYFLAKRDQLIRDFKGGERKLALVMGENDFPTILSQNGELKEQIDMIAPAGLACRFTVIGDAGHVPANALLEGLRRLYAGWKPAKSTTGSGD